MSDLRKERTLRVRSFPRSVAAIAATRTVATTGIIKAETHLHATAVSSIVVGGARGAFAVSHRTRSALLVGQERGQFFDFRTHLRAARFGHLLPMAAEQGAFQRVEQIQAGFEARALDLHEGADGTGRHQIVLGTNTHLTEPCGRLGTHVRQLALTHRKDSR